jgi:hypothetical protein
MPTSRLWQLQRVLFFTKLVNNPDDNPPDDIYYLYDDPAFNEKLGIRRHGDTFHHDDPPVQFKGGDEKAFTSYISALRNASEEDLKGKDNHATLNAA